MGNTQSATISLSDIESHSPEKILLVDEEFADEYSQRVHFGISNMKRRSAVFVAICRNAMPFLPFTLARVKAAGELFKDYSVFIYENDSTDETKDFLEHWKALDSTRHFCEMRVNGRPHLNYTKENARTIALAEYRNQCRLWAATERGDADYVIVFDTDPWGGVSIEGIANTLGHLEDYDGEYSNASCFASYSWCEWGPPVWQTPTICHYDAWACRWTWWNERQNMLWFHLWHPPVGSPPVKMNSAFGQLAVYRSGDFFNSEYQGGDCEHVPFHRGLRGDLYLNPSQRVVSFWVPK